MLQPENQSRKYDALFADIDTGRIKVPMFQRDFVWTKEQTSKLIDSIIKGFPIGTFIGANYHHFFTLQTLPRTTLLKQVSSLFYP